MTLRLLYPAKPFTITQGWGIYNPAYLQFGFSRHNGYDFKIGDDKKLYCPVQNLEIYDTEQGSATGWRVKGNTKDFYDFPDGVKARVNMVFMHLAEKSPLLNGQIIQTGDYMGIPDNTGFSTGPHTHWLCRRIDQNGQLLDKNEADNSLDQGPYFTGYFAVDTTKLIPLLLAQVEALMKLL